MRIVTLAVAGVVFSLVGGGMASADTVSLHFGQEAAGIFGLYEVTSIDASASGDLFVLGQDSENVFRVGPGGHGLQIASSQDGLVQPRRLSLAPSGDLYIVANGQSVVRIPPTGGVESVDFGGVLNSVVDVAGDSAGNVYATSATATFPTGVVFKRTPGGSVSVAVSPSGAGAGMPLTFPTRLAIDEQDNLYVTGYQSNNAFRITPAGAITQIIDSDGDHAGNPLLSPRGIDVDAQGYVYVTGEASSNAFRIAPGGAITEIIDATGDGLHALEGVADVAVDASGNAYVVAWGTDNAFHIAPDGAVRQIIDATGDGIGNTLEDPVSVAVEGHTVYVAGLFSHNVFRIRPIGTPALAPVALLALALTLVATGWRTSESSPRCDARRR